MKPSKKIIFGSLLGLLFLFLWTELLGANEFRRPIKEPLPTPERARIDPVAARLNDEGVLTIREVSARIGDREEEVGKATASAATWRFTAADRAGKTQEQIGETIRDNASLVFEQLDLLGRVQQELGGIIRDNASLKFQTTQEIESVRAGLEEIMRSTALMQIALSERIGEGQEEIGRAIVATQVFPPGTDAFGKAQERLGQAILDNTLLLRQTATELGENEEHLGLAIRDHAALLVSATEKLGRGEEKLGQMILRHAQMLRVAKETIGKGQERLGLAIREGARVEWETVEQFGAVQERLAHAILNDAIVRHWAREIMEEAIAKLIMATEIDPTFTLVHYNCAIAFLSRNAPADVKNAIHHLEMGLALEPQNRMLLTFYEEIVDEG